MAASPGRCAALLVTLVACGRSPLDPPQPAYTSGGGAGSGDAGAVMNGTAGQLPISTGTGGVTLGSGGAPSSGGAVGTGSTVSTGGALGSGGRVGTGGVASTGGRSASGGALATGGRSGTAASSGGASAAGGTSASGGARSAGGNTTSGGATGAGGHCGDGSLGPGEQCDLGAGNQALPALWISQSGAGFAAIPLMGDAPSWRFYGYASDSAHTGFEAAGASRILLYLDTSSLALSLVVIHGVDKDATGMEQATAQVQMLFDGLPRATNVCVADDYDELALTSSTTAKGTWRFANNSDGGVLCVLPFPGDWEITVAPTFDEGISTWSWVQRDGSLIALDLTRPLSIKARNLASLCRLDCTTPRCGDGILDAGEICDDGTQAPDGCGLACLTSH